VQKISRVVAEYVRFEHAGGVIELRKHLRKLPRPESRIAWTGLVCAAAVVIATPLLAGFAPQFGQLVFEDARGRSQSVPGAAVTLALAAFSIAWGYILSGAALGPGLLWIVTALMYIFLTVHIGFAIGRSYLHVVALMVPVVVGALSPMRRSWSNVLLGLLVASIAVRLAPLPPALRAFWYLVWVPAGGLMLGLDHLLSRRPWTSAARRAGLATVIIAGYFLAVGMLVPNPGIVAGALSLSLDLAIGFFGLLWFLLGASFVSGAISLGRFAHRVVEIVTPKPLPRWAVPILCILLAVWVTRFPQEGTVFAARPLAAGLLMLLLMALGLRWRRSGITHEWVAGWLVATIAALAILRAYATLDIGDLLVREAGILSLAAFTYAIVWEVAGRLSKVPLSTPHFLQPSPMLLYLGLVLLISAASLFAIAGNLQYFQEVVVLQQYRGAVSLWIPMGLLVLVRAWPGGDPAVGPLAVRAFLVGALLAVAVFLTLASGAPGMAAAGAVAAVVVLAVYLVRRWPHAPSLLSGAAIGVAVALGFAVSLSQRVLVDLLPPLLGMPAVLFGIPALRSAAVAIRQWSDAALWQPSDRFLYYAAAPVLALGAAALAVRIRGAGGCPKGS
jgi:hypothetical protein